MLGVDRKTVAKIIAEHELDRTGAPLKRRKSRTTLLDPFQENMVQLLERYPDITAVRMLEELRRLGFKGAYTIVKDHLRNLRRHPRKLIRRFETGPGVQSQMDFSSYDIDFTDDHRFRLNDDLPLMKDFGNLPANNTHIVAIVLFGLREGETGEIASNNFIVTAYQKEIG